MKAQNTPNKKSVNLNTSKNGPISGNRGGGTIGDNLLASDGDTMSLHNKLNALEKDLERRQESYISRERAYKLRIDELEEELASQRLEKTGWMKSDPNISKLKSMQNQILNNVELVQDRTARILQEQERDLLRAFRARLFDVQTELEKEKSKKDDGAAAWIERSRQLESEVEWAKEVADRLERVNQTLLQENGRLKSQFNSQEEDRNFLIKQLVSVKKDNARIRAEFLELEKEHEEVMNSHMNATNDANQGGIASPTGRVAPQDRPGNSTQESEERFKEVNVRLRRLLAEERKSLQQVRTNYATELKSRTEIELLLRQCVEDVRQEIARRHLESAQFSNNSGNDLAKLYSKQPGLVPLDDFSKEDRERVLELLLSQERVVSLLYAKAFPVNIASLGASSTKGSSGAVPGRPPQSGLSLGPDVGGTDASGAGGVPEGLNGHGDHTASHDSLQQQQRRPSSGSGPRPQTGGDGGGTRLPALQSR